MKYICILLSAFVITRAQSQTLTDYIPANAEYVFSMNLQQLNTKSNQMDYTKYLTPLIRSTSGNYYDYDNNCSIISVEDIIKSPSDFGIGQNLYVYKTSTGDISGTTFLFSISDSKKFASKLKTDCIGSSKMYTKTIENGMVYAGTNTSLSYNDKMAVLFVKSFSYSDYYSDYDVAPVEAAPAEEAPAADSATVYEMDEVDTTSAVIDAPIIEELIDAPAEQYEEDSALIRERAEKNKLMLEKIAGYLEKCLLPVKENYTANRNFSKLAGGQHDAFFYFNSFDMLYSRMYFPFNSGGYNTMLQPNNTNRFLTSEMNSTYTLDFENGSVKMNVLSNYNKNVYPYMKATCDVKQSKKLFKYIDGKNLMGYMSVAVNSEEMAKFYAAFYKELFGGITSGTTRRSQEYYNILQAAELFYAFIDKEMLYNTVKSQAIFACTGFEDVKIKYTTYEYDEDFKPIEKTAERIEKQPQMVLASAIGNKENARKLFDIISKFTVFTKVNDNVFVFSGNQYMHLNIYFALTDDAFIITNNANLALNHLKGYEKDQQLDKAEKAKILQHNACMKIYGSKMMTGINDAYFKNGETFPWFAKMMSSLGDVEMYDTKPTENGYGMSAVLNLKDNSTNALYQLLKMISSVNEH